MSNPKPFQSQLDTAVQAALKAGAFIRSHAGSLSWDDVQEKGRHDLVTFVDEGAQRIVLEVLQSAFPDYDILAEEGIYSKDRTPLADGYRWIIDPVDGTTNFTHNLSPFAVSIGLQREAELVVGVVYEVGHDELFTATRGGGLFFNGRRAHVSDRKTMKQALVTTGFPFEQYIHIDPYLETLKGFMYEAQAVRRMGAAAVDYAHVACGRLDGFFETGLSPWDSAAGALLVEEGGGRVTDLEGGDAYLFGGRMIASNGLLHDDMLRLTTPLREALALLKA